MGLLTTVANAQQADASQIDQVINLLNNRWRFRAYRSVDYTNVPTVATRYPFDTVGGGTGLLGDPASLLSLTGQRFTVPTGGTGTWAFAIQLFQNNSGERMQIYKNGSAIGPVYNTSGNTQAGVKMEMLDLVAGDYVEVFYWRTGASQTQNGGAGEAYWMGWFVGLNP